MLSSCGEDPELTRKLQIQEAEITRLRGELALIEERLKNLPPDKSSELAEAKKQAEIQASEISLLEAEIASLEERKKSLKQEFEEYKRKYYVKEPNH